MKDEAVVARCAFALGPGQCVLFMGFGVKEDGEVFSNRCKAQLDHFFWA